VSREKRRQTEDEILKAAEVAARELRGFAPMPRWLTIGRGLVILRRRAMEETGAKKPNGSGYQLRFGAMLRQHGMDWICHTTRAAIINIVENLKEVERRLAKLPDERRIRMGLNSPQVIWNFVLSERRKEAGKDGKGLRPEDPVICAEKFQSLVDTIAESLPSGDVVEIAVSVCEVLGFRVPDAVLKRAQRRERIQPTTTAIYPTKPLPWSPFAMEPVR
jgi:hypothetical protein